MQWLSRFWNRILTASAGSGYSPGIDGDEGGVSPDFHNPQEESGHGKDGGHTWKSHGGFRH